MTFLKQNSLFSGNALRKYINLNINQFIMLDFNRKMWLPILSSMQPALTLEFTDFEIQNQAKICLV